MFTCICRVRKSMFTFYFRLRRNMFISRLWRTMFTCRLSEENRVHLMYL